MSNRTHIWSTLADEGPDATRRRRHAATQCRHAARLRAIRAPRADDLGRALVAAARGCLRERLADGIPGGERRAWEDLIETAVAELEAKGFARGEARRRLLRALHPLR